MPKDGTDLKDVLLGFNIPQIIRYLYSGFLLVGLLQLTPSKATVNATISSFGELLSVISIFFLGVVIWTIYHQIIGEFLFFHLAHLFHRWLAKSSSDMQLLSECGVPFGRRRIAPTKC